MDKRTQEILRSLAARQNLRVLNTVATQGASIESEGRRFVNFSSNDYLGLSSDIAMQEQFFDSLDVSARFLMSNPSSRLMTGNSPEYDELEYAIAQLFGSDRRSLVLSSGFLINAGLLPALTTKNDLILADKLVHASIIEGMKLSAATHMRFNHNDMEHLEKLLEKYRDDYQNVWVVTESVFSMDGDRAPLTEFVRLKKHFGLKLYLDEAHAFGVYGDNGAGLAASQGIVSEFDIIVATLGKAAASCGAFIVCDSPTRELLINTLRPLIFSTALPPLNLLWTKWVIDRIPQMHEQRKKLRELSQIIIPDREFTHIIPLMAYENSRALELSNQLRECGFWVTAVRWPTVPRAQARLRLSLNAAIESSDAKRLIETWNSIG